MNACTSRLLGFTVCLFVPLQLLGAEALRYALKPNLKFVYEVTIVADEPTTKESYTGHIRYSVNEDGKLSYKGGLKKKVVKKSNHPDNRRRRGPFGGPPPPRGFGNPFTRRVNPFKGTEQTTSQLELNDQGHLISIKGSSHLPYLIGHLSLLPFEPFPKDAESRWEYSTGIIVSEARERVERIHPIGGPFNPFGSGRSDESAAKKTSGGESCRYEIVKEKDDVVEIRKTASLNVAAQKGEPEIRVEGNGTWAFNRKLGIPESLEYTHKLTSESKNQRVTVPVTIRFDRLSSEKWAAIVAEREAKEKMAREEHERRIAEKKAKAEAPLTPEEMAATLKELASDSSKTLQSRLKQLSAKTPKNPETEVAAAIRPLIDHEDKKVREEAEKALAKYSPEYNKEYSFRTAYRKGSEVEATPFVVPPDFKLPAGLIVLYEEGDKWYPGKVVKETEKGDIELKQVRWPHWGKKRKRGDLRLADRKAEQPEVKEEILAQLYGNSPAGENVRIGMRVWTDKSGGFQVEGKFDRLEDGQVFLELRNGKTAKVPLEQLSDGDRKYVTALQSKPKKANPFQIVE